MSARNRGSDIDPRLLSRSLDNLLFVFNFNLKDLLMQSPRTAVALYNNQLLEDTYLDLMNPMLC